MVSMWSWLASLRGKATTREPFFEGGRIGFLDGWGAKGARSRPRDTRANLEKFIDWAYAAAILNANAIASVPLRLYGPPRRGRATKSLKITHNRKRYLSGDGTHVPSKTVLMSMQQRDVEEIVDHPLLSLLRKVNPIHDGFGWSSLRMQMLQITGNSYIHLITDGVGGPPKEMWVLPSHAMEIVPGKTGEEIVRGYRYGLTEPKTDFGTEDVLHQLIPHPHEILYGRGWFTAAAKSLDLWDAMQEYQQAMFDNMCRPDWAIFIKDFLTESQRKQIRDDVKSQHAGPRKQGGMNIFEGGIDARALNITPKDLEYSIGENRIIERVAGMSGVPVSKLKANDPNRSNAELGDYAWKADTIRPYILMDEEWLNAKLVPLFGEEGIFLAYDNPVPRDTERESRMSVADVSTGIMTINEARALRGLDPAPDGDVLRVNGVPLDRVGMATPLFGNLGGGADTGPGDEGPSEDEDDGDDDAESKAIGRSNRGCLDSSFGRLDPIGLHLNGHAGGVCVVRVSRARGEAVGKCGSNAQHECGSDALLGDWCCTHSHRKSVGLKAAGFDAVLSAAVQALEAALRSGATVTESLLTADGRIDRAKLAEALKQSFASIKGPAETLFLDMAVSGSAAGVDKLPAALRFDVRPDEIIAMASERADELVNYIGEKLAEQATAVSEQLLDSGLSPIEAARELRARMEDVSVSRSETIMRTESAHAYVDGEVEAWRQSGVVTGKKWLLAPDPCPFCAKVAADYADRSIPLAGTFVRAGETLIAGDQSFTASMGDISGPPLHPHCECDLVPTLESDQ